MPHRGLRGARQDAALGQHRANGVPQGVDVNCASPLLTLIEDPVEKPIARLSNGQLTAGAGKSARRETMLRALNEVVLYQRDRGASPSSPIFQARIRRQADTS